MGNNRDASACPTSQPTKRATNHRLGFDVALNILPSRRASVGIFPFDQNSFANFNLRFQIEAMNKKQKCLTILALIIFALMGLYEIVEGCIPPFEGSSYVRGIDFGRLLILWFMLAIIYAGLFFVFKGKSN
jgi:hypothetical protein